MSAPRRTAIVTGLATDQAPPPRTPTGRLFPEGPTDPNIKAELERIAAEAREQDPDPPAIYPPPCAPFFIMARMLPYSGFVIEAGWRTDQPAPWIGLKGFDSRIGRALTEILRGLGKPPEQD